MKRELWMIIPYQKSQFSQISPGEAGKIGIWVGKLCAKCP